MSLTISSLAIRNKTTTKKLIMREVLNYLTHNHLLYYKINLSPLETLEKLCKKRVHGMIKFHNLSF